jgi:hypothetical protein
MVRAPRWPSIDWLIRATHNRCLADGDKLWDRLAQAPVLGEVRFTLPARPNRPSRPVVLTVRAERVTLQPKGGEPVTVTALRAREESPPAGVEPLDWRLLTNRPADTLAQAAELLQWYGSRWCIEIYQPYNLHRTILIIREWLQRVVRCLQPFALTAAAPTLQHQHALTKSDAPSWCLAEL